MKNKINGRRVLALLLALLLIATLFPVEQIVHAVGNGLIYNGNFSVTGTDGIPGWTGNAQNGNNGSVGTVDAGGLHGTAAYIKTDSVYGLSIDSDYLAEVNAGGIYELTFQAKLSHSNSRLQVYAFYYRADGGAAELPYSQLNCTVTGSAGWQKARVQINVPADARKLGLSFVLTSGWDNGSNETAWLDDVRLQNTDKTLSTLHAGDLSGIKTAYSPDMVPEPKTGIRTNLVTNGSFDEGSTGWNVSVSPATNSWRVTDSGDTAQGPALKTMLPANNGQVYAESGWITAEPNFIYTISYKVKLTPNSTDNLPPYGCVAIVQEMETGGSVVGKPYESMAVNQTNGWKTVTFEYTTGAQASLIRLDLMHANIAGTAYWDDITVTAKQAYNPVILDASYDHGGTADTQNSANLIKNGTFDAGSTAGWSLQEGMEGLSTANTNGGVLRFEVSPGRYLQTGGLVVQSESEYELTYYVKVENARDLELLAYFYTGGGDNWRDFLSATVTSNTGGAWKKVTIRFATPKLTAGTTATIGFKALHTQQCAWQKNHNLCDCGSSGLIYLDDISLIRTGTVTDVSDGKVSSDSVILNGTFNRYYSDPYTVDGWDMNIANKNHNTYIQSGVARSGNAIRMEATGHSYIWCSDFSVEAGSIYMLSYWVRVDEASNLKFAPYMNDANYGGGWWLDDAVQPVYETTNGWVKMSGAVSIPASVGENANNPGSKVQLGFQVYQGSGVLYLDDVSMVKVDVSADDTNLNFELNSEILYNWAFASYNGGNGSAGTSSEVYPGSGGGVSALIYNQGPGGESIFNSSLIAVEPNTTYEFTYWTKQAGSYDALSVQFFRQVGEDGKTSATSLSWDGNRQMTVQSEFISMYWTYQVQGEVDWRQVCMSVTTGPDTYFLEIRFLVQGKDTRTYIDDVTLTEVPQTPNLDFEATSTVTGSPANWYLSTARSQTVAMDADTSVYHSGAQSLHIVKDSLLEKTVLDSAVYIPVNSDNIYEFSFWMCSRNASPDCVIRMNLQLYREDGTRIYRNDGNYQTIYGTVSQLNSGTQMSDWVKVTTRSAPISEAAYATISFTITRGYGEIWIDDIFMDVVEDGTDCVVYYNDFHAVDQNGNISDWKTETVSGEAQFVGAEKGATLTISQEAYIRNTMKCIMTDYTYTVIGNYSADVGMTAEIRFYDYKMGEYVDERVAVPLRAGEDRFEISFTAPSNAYASLWIGGKQAGSITVSNVTIYMVAKPAGSSDWDGFWVWYPENPVKEAVEQYRYFRYTFVLDDDAEYAPFQLTVDDKYAFYLNGELIDDNWDAGTDSWANVQSYDLTNKVRKGVNVIALKCYNLVSEAGILFDGKFTLRNQSTVTVASSSYVLSTKTVNEQTTDWTQVDYDDSGWVRCIEYGQPPCSPWGPVFYNSTLYIHNNAEVISTTVPDAVTAGKTLKFTVTMKLDEPIESKFSPVVTLYKRNSIKDITSIPMTFQTNANPKDWPVGQEFTVECSISLPDYLETGRYELQMDENVLLLSGKNVHDNKFVTFKVLATSSPRDPVHSAVEIYNGTPTLMIDGEPMASYFYLRPDLNVYLQTDAETRIYQSGLELYVTYGGSLYKGGCDPIWLEDGTIDYEAFDSVIYETMAANNDALVMVNIGMFAPKWWLEQNPGHEATAYNGIDYIGMSDVSLASEKFREEAGQVLRDLIRHMKQQSYYNRVFGLKISGGQTYEWFCWGTGPNQGPDYSQVSQDGFRTYLRKKYETVEALREAWGDETVTFENASAPGWLERGESDNVIMGNIGQKVPRQKVDWNLWLNEASADSFLYYCQIAKEETDNQLIVGGYNGYLWTSNSYDSQGMAHTAMDRVLDSEYVDWIASPVAYNERLLGESNTYMALIDSVQEHGKLYIAEQDNRTCLSNVYAGASWDADWDFQVGQTRTIADTIHQLKRDFANAMVNGVGLWNYDMYGGWLDDSQIYDLIRNAKAEYDLSVYLNRSQRNDVAVFVGDETYAYITADAAFNMPYNLLEPMLMQQRKHLAAMGAGYDTYAMSSLLEGKVSDHKLNIILSPFEITEQMQQAIDTHLKKNGQYVVWVYLPGISDGKTYNLSNVERATGFKIGVMEEKSGLQVQIANTDHPLTQGIEGLIYGASQPNSVSPLAYIEDTEGIAVLGYNMDGERMPGLAIKDMGNWTSIYSAAPCLDVSLLRNLMELSGCHTYSRSNEDVIYSNNHYVAVHSATAGEKTITLPSNCSVYDVFNGKFISMNTSSFTYYHEADETYIFRLMTPDTFTVTARRKSGKGALSAPGLTEAAPGGGYTLTVTPEEGYEVDCVMVNGEIVQLNNNALLLDSVNENTVIEVKFSKLPEMVEVIETVTELIVLPWWAGVGILAVLVAVCVALKKVVDVIRPNNEEEGVDD